jgi:hypothetical protein
MAKAYANDFIGHHLKNIAGGKTYAEVSSAAMADPTNADLQKQKTALFQGETLRGMLLGDGYGFLDLWHDCQMGCSCRFRRCCTHGHLDTARRQAPWHAKQPQVITGISSQNACIAGVF